jgi:crossover junction endodeoxyribonuclease RusA
MTFFLELPWPPSTLSPNQATGRSWQPIHRARSAYRDACCTATLLALHKRTVRDEPMRLAMEFRPPPDGRDRDRDNLIARMKAGIDGVARALRINDSRFVEVSGRVGPPAEAAHMARVSVTITADVPSPAPFVPRSEDVYPPGRDGPRGSPYCGD